MAKNRFKTWAYWRDEWVNPFLVAVILAMIIRTFIMQPFKIPSTSMVPTLKVGDRIFVNKFLYGARIPFINKRLPKVRGPKRGDVSVFVSVEDDKYPEPREDYIKIFGPVFFNKMLFYNKVKKRFIIFDGPRFIVKRVVGLPGETVEIKRGDIYIDRKLLEKPLIIKKITYSNTQDGRFGRENWQIKVPEDSYYVLGDNSPNSRDSRFWGFVPKENLTGKAFIIWWPPHRIRILR